MTADTHSVSAFSSISPAWRECQVARRGRRNTVQFVPDPAWMPRSASPGFTSPQREARNASARARSAATSKPAAVRRALGFRHAHAFAASSMGILADSVDEGLPWSFLSSSWATWVHLLINPRRRHSSRRAAS